MSERRLLMLCERGWGNLAGVAVIAPRISQVQLESLPTWQKSYQPTNTDYRRRARYPTRIEGYHKVGVPCNSTSTTHCSAAGAVSALRTI